MRFGLKGGMMLSRSLTDATKLLKMSMGKITENRRMLMRVMVITETLLVLMALVPPQVWARLFPSSPHATLDGPFPPLLAPIVTALLYLLPGGIGFIAHDWQRALLYATLPAWIGLGLFLIIATFRVGAFYLLSTEHVVAHVSILELFAALGGIGWLLRSITKES